MLIKTLETPLYKVWFQVHDNVQACGFPKGANIGGALEWDWQNKPDSVAKMGFNMEHLTMGIIAHECVHLAFRIFDARGVFANPDNDEHFAYLVEWLVDQVSKALLSHQKKKGQKNGTTCYTK